MASVVYMAVSCGGGFLKGRLRRHVAAGRGGGGAGRVSCSASSSSSPYYVRSLMEHYRTLRIQTGASEKEVKKAFRQLALQYHPDVCKGSNCGVEFHRINEAYDSVMSSLRQAEEPETHRWKGDDGFVDEETRGMYDPSWELWEEWMGWEGAGIRDYSSHINPYI